MKKNRIIALLLALSMMFSLLAGCSQGSEPSKAPGTPSAPGNSDSAGSGGSTEADLSAKTIGVVVWGTDDATTAPIKALLDYLAGSIGYSVIYKTGDFDGDAQLSAVENLINSGVDGIIMMPIVDLAIENYYQACEDAGIPYIQFFRGIVDDDLREDMLSREYFLGWTNEDDVAAGYEMVRLLAEQGAKNFACIYMAAGNPATDDRQTGFEKALADGLGTKVTEFMLPFGNGTDPNLYTQATLNFVDQYGDGIDAILSSVGSNGGSEAILAAIETSGAGYVAGEFDMPSTAADALKKGSLGCTAEGMMCDIVYVFAVMANYLMGTPLSDGPVCIDTGYIFVTSAEEQEQYYQYVESDGVYAYTADEFKQMLRAYNPDFSPEDLQALAHAWSLQDVIDRHS